MRSWPSWFQVPHAPKAVTSLARFSTAVAYARLYVQVRTPVNAAPCAVSRPHRSVLIAIKIELRECPRTSRFLPTASCLRCLPAFLGWICRYSALVMHNLSVLSIRHTRLQAPPSPPYTRRAGLFDAMRCDAPASHTVCLHEQLAHVRATEIVHAGTPTVASDVKGVWMSPRTFSRKVASRVCVQYRFLHVHICICNLSE
ncbi:hypothetical protein AcV5_010436 [Taiwanofungus camphoratus]|nr:hypothetical protein AcV5_010436 [Antrodia cinnamomea]